MKGIYRIIVICISLFIASISFAANLNSPVGFWKTIDDVTGRPKSILQISMTSNNTLYGKVVKLFPGAMTTCTACEGEKHNKPILGMTVMENLKQTQGSSNEWSDGMILDPKNGKTYHVTIRVIDGGQKLNVRGYIGISLFGRTQTWLRVNSANSG